MAGASAAIDFCTSVFGASVVTRNDLPNGKVAHADLSSSRAGCS